MNPFGVSRIIALPFLLAAVCADPTECKRTFIGIIDSHSCFCRPFFYFCSCYLIHFSGWRRGGGVEVVMDLFNTPYSIAPLSQRSDNLCGQLQLRRRPNSLAAEDAGIHRA